MSQHFNPRVANTLELYDSEGRRLYINEDERTRFLEAAKRAEYPKRQFGMLLALTGCRLSEGRDFRRSDLQEKSQRVALHTLKRKKGKPTREVPVEPNLIEELLAIESSQIGPASGLLWHANDDPIPRSTAYRWIKELMDEAGISGKQASPKDLRHGFAAWAILSNIPLTILQKWMGHAALETTQCYTQLCGPEEMRVARRMWSQKAPIIDAIDLDEVVEAIVTRLVTQKLAVAV